jgi:Ti-type conjugative transfer relaxase TraA
MLAEFHAVAIYHLSMKPVTRSSGRSAVAAAAYRSGDDLTNERDGERHDFTHRGGVEQTEIVLPSGVDAEWAKDRSKLWNAAEAAEHRKDSRVAREIEIALPHELQQEERLALVREFSQSLADRHGVAVDFAIHSPHSLSDARNHHAHLLMTTRKVERDGLGEKSVLEWENKKLVAYKLPITHNQLRSVRQFWEEHANVALARANLDLRVDHRSHATRGIEIEPTQHVGVHATQMARRGKEVSRVPLEAEAGKRNAQVIKAYPDQVLSLITNEKSVFDRHDVARALHRAIDDPTAFQSGFARVMSSDALVELQPERKERDEQGLSVTVPARYSTREMVEIERNMAAATDRLLERQDAKVARGHVKGAIAERPYLSAEQKEAIEHVTGDQRIAVVVGLAGAGKSTLLEAARDAWEAGGYRVQGAALAGKAAEELQVLAGIPSRTLASWQNSWERGLEPLGKRDVLVIDEAGMVGSRQLARFIGEADRVGSKVVLVGDPEQLQPIGAGAAFRAVAERSGFVELEGVRRQDKAWQRTASVDFGRYRTDKALKAYEAHRAVRLENSKQAAQTAIVQEVLADREARPGGTRLVLAHRNADVLALNQAIRGARLERGELEGELTYRTSEGVRSFAAGDRIAFRQNHGALGVKNGMLGTVEKVRHGHLAVRMDTDKGEGKGKAVSVDVVAYPAVDHGYATTIHKSQGATVDRTWVLASPSMDRHLTYVSMTRHREGVQLYAGKDEFRSTADLIQRLSRGGAKETTLDYDSLLTRDDRQRQQAQPFAQRRGIWLDGDIVVPKHEIQTIREPKQEPSKEKGRFEGMKFKVHKMAPMKAPQRQPAYERGPETERSAQPVSPAHVPAQRRDGMTQQEQLGQAVERFAVAWNKVNSTRRQGLSVPMDQAVALRDTARALDQVRSQATQDLISAVKYDPDVRQALTGQHGRSRSEALVDGLIRESVVRQHPGFADVRQRRAHQEEMERQQKEQEAARQARKAQHHPELVPDWEHERERDRDRGMSR